MNNPFVFIGLGGGRRCNRVILFNLATEILESITYSVLEQKYSWCHVPEIGSVGVFLGGNRLPNGALRITVTVLLLEPSEFCVETA